MTPEQTAQVEEAKKRIRALARQWMAEGRPAGALTAALKGIEGFGLHWGAESASGGVKGLEATREGRRQEADMLRMYREIVEGAEK